MTQDDAYMKRAIELARNGAGFVSPNPMVGCVIVKNEKIIAEGYHKKFGASHAEIWALGQSMVDDKRYIGATMYVNLEPCVHEDKKTPPCVPAIIVSGVSRVVIGMKDPNPKVAGRGIRALRRADIRVDVGVLEYECRELNEAFVKWITTGRPFVLLKVAITLDGALTFKKGTRSDVSSPESYAYVHELRQQYDAIAIGSESVLTDDPLLTTRHKNKKSRNPVRVIFDRRLRTPKSARLLKQQGKTIIFSRKEGKVSGATVVRIPSLSPALGWLGENGITSVMVEGGAKLARSFLRENLVDIFMITVTPHVSGDPAAPRLFGKDSSQFMFSNLRWETRGVDAWLIAKKE